MSIKKVNANEDAFGSALLELLDSFGIKTFIFSGIGKDSAGVTSMHFENTSLGVTSLALLVRAVPDLFLIFEEAKLGAYVSMIENMLAKGMPVEKESDGSVNLDDFIVKGKLKN